MLPLALTLKSFKLRHFTALALTASVFATLYLCLGTFMLPGSLGFTLFIGYICSCFGGWIVSFIGIAPLVGMVFAGVLLRNTGATQGVAPSIVASQIRTIAVAIILARTGMGLSFKALRTERAAILALGLIPSITGALLGTLFAYAIFGFPILWALMFGFGLACTSPAVVAPITLAMQEKGYGNADNLGTILLGALPIDIMVAVVGHSLLMGAIFSEGDKVMVYAHAPIEIASGIFGGLFLAGIVFLASKAPTSCAEEKGIIFALFLSVSFSVALIGRIQGYTGSAAMANICLWTSVANLFPIDDVAIFQTLLKTIWSVAEPLLFSVIGMSLSFKLVDARTVGLAIAVVLALEITRLPVTFASMKLVGRGTKQAMYVAGKWSGKATIQAALGASALDLAKANGSKPEQVAMATTLLATYLLSVILMAPAAAIWVQLTQSRLLTCELDNRAGISIMESRKNSNASTVYIPYTSQEVNDDFIVSKQHRKNTQTNKQSKKQADVAATGPREGRHSTSDILRGEGKAEGRRDEAPFENEPQMGRIGQDSNVHLAENMDLGRMEEGAGDLVEMGVTDRSASPESNTSSSDINSTSGGNSASRSSGNDEDSYSKHSSGISERDDEHLEQMQESSSHSQQNHPPTHHLQSHEQFQPHPHLRGVALDSNTMFSSKSNPSYAHTGPAFIYAQAAGIARSHQLSYQQQLAFHHKAAMLRGTPSTAASRPQITPPISEGHSARENQHSARSNDADPFHLYTRYDVQAGHRSPPEHPSQTQPEQARHHHHHHHHHKHLHNYNQQERSSRPRLRSNTESVLGRSLSSDSISSYAPPSYAQTQSDISRTQLPFAVAMLAQQANHLATRVGVGRNDMSRFQINAPSPNQSSDGGLSNTSTLLGIQPDVVTPDGSLNPALLALIDDAKRGLRKINKTRKKLQRSASWSGESSRDSLSNSSGGEGNSSGERGRKLAVRRVSFQCGEAETGFCGRFWVAQNSGNRENLSRNRFPEHNNPRTLTAMDSSTTINAIHSPHSAASIPSIPAIPEPDRTNTDTTRLGLLPSSREPTLIQAPVYAHAFGITVHQIPAQAPFRLNAGTGFSPLQLYHNIPQEINGWLNEPEFSRPPLYSERASEPLYQYQQVVTIDGHLDPRILALVHEAQIKLLQMKERKKRLGHGVLKR
ncbi:Sodium/hydrogen exchanger family-domain-containing protein [Chytriomyces cf. hyalinus JEL632]|nr:Sodium/hydrogen exchanger family-domain-containing protein [Chytriomyces cf. hyalinus JEL632]